MAQKTRADAAKTQPVAQSDPHGETSSDEGAQASLSPGAQALLQFQTSEKSQLGQQVLMSNVSTGIVAVAEGLTLAAAGGAAVAVGGSELAGVATMAPELLPAITNLLKSAAGAKAIGGALSGGISQAVQGGDAGQIVVGAGVNAVVSAASPFSFIGGTALGQAAPTFAKIASGGLNSLSANVVAQGTAFALHGTAPNPTGTVVSTAGGAFFAGVTAATPAVGIGANVVYGVAKGANSGLLGGATGSIVRF
jgi:hypothetical protein